MVVVSRFISIVLRTLELISAVIVAGIVGHYLNQSDERDIFPEKRMIYTEVVAGLSIFFALIMLIPFTWAINAFVLDFVMFVLWIVSFGLLVDYVAPSSCKWGIQINPFYYGDGLQETCERWKASVAFSFISAMLWLASSVLAMWVLYRMRRHDDVTIRRRPWYRRHI
ncbi:integral membrane protein [Ascodesmis nigricans]|uniref:Integral membrane protein n=1 Tax=Ascodesmis nigricans TaxID=341454 RepID=A0A4S2MM35_9PEZI|nr:integral membrane protein [Ascodesmis nigricans]